MSGQEAVFQAFTAEQAANYAIGRANSYPEILYQSILSYHQGPRDLLLDVGTGPGMVVWDLLKQHFRSAIGCDASPGMIAHAKQDAEKFGLAGRTTFTVTGAEDCAAAVSGPAGSGSSGGVVDLVTVGTAAHWFDLPAFYRSAAQALRSGGTLAMWIPSSSYVHPSVPHAREIQAVMSDLEDTVLRPYYQKGSLYARHGYDDLPLPWDGADGEAVATFDKASFKRVQWDREGLPSAPPLPDGSPGPFLFGREMTFKQAEKALSTSSSVIRWREAHPDKAGTEEDVVKIMIKRVRDIAGDIDRITIAPSCTLLLMWKA
ncbi:hypothetical protein B0A55_06653 [Friedmanniomyces simplex]|uniref:Methyltransferase domain-containing protein n=1 Tax=Friedmanniomyces simplex TaxID=329884 RepID=A0A4U0XCC4_9PEZI|nr:hypothetical protein B0A55_06653 [Friedmanniomyces simplex]